MTRVRTLAGTALLLACAHDVEQLATPPGSWLPPSAGAECIGCIVAECPDEERACAASATCVSSYRACDAPSPTCGVGSLENRSFAACVVGACRDTCGFPARELMCVGNYSWPKPQSGGPTRVFADLRSFDNLALPATQAELCSELHSCQALTPVMGARYQGSYEWSDASPFRPIVRVHGDDVQSALYFEGAEISSDYLLTVSVLRKATYAALLDVVQAPHDESLGAIAAVMYGCSTSRLSGVTFQLERDHVPLPASEQGIPFYLHGVGPALPSQQARATQDTNVGGFANVAPGVYDVVALSERVIGRMNNVVVEEGSLTQVNIFPLDADQLP